MSNPTTARYAGVGDKAVRRATGRGWYDWFALLDASEAHTRSHPEIVALLKPHAELSGWWQQQITVGYEQARGLRQAHEKPSGFEISRSRTIDASTRTLFAAWRDGRRRRAWLGVSGLTLRSAEEPRRLRLRWSDGRSLLEASLQAKGPRKTQVTVQHGKLADAAEAAAMKEFWGAALERLREWVGG